MNLNEFLKRPEGKLYSQAEWARRFFITRGYMNRLVHHEAVPSLPLAVHIDECTGGMVDVKSWPCQWPPERGDTDDGTGCR